MWGQSLALCQLSRAYSLVVEQSSIEIRVFALSLCSLRWLVLIIVEPDRGGHCCFLFTRTFDVDPQQHLLWSCFQDGGCIDTMTVWVSWGGWSFPRKLGNMAERPTWHLSIHWDSSCMKPWASFYQYNMALISIRLPFWSWTGTICSVSASLLSLACDHSESVNLKHDQRDISLALCSVMDTVFSCLGSWL